MLTLHQQFFILMLHEEKVVVLPNAACGFPYWLGGAILADLALMGKIQVSNNQRLELIDREQTGHPILDEMIARLQSIDSAKKLNYWIDEFDFKPKKVYQQLFACLVEAGVLEHRDDDFYWITPYPSEAPSSASAKLSMRHQLRSRSLAHLEPNLQTISLVCLLQASNQMDLAFFKDERKKVRRWVDEMIMNEAIKSEKARAIQEIATIVSSRIDED